MFPLFSLPDELIEAIFFAIEDRPTLVALAQTCSKLQPFAEAQLFRSVYVRDGPSVLRLKRDLEQPSWRLRKIENLEVTPNVHLCRGIEEMPKIVGQLPRLKSLKLESPTIRATRMERSWWINEIMVDYMNLFSKNRVSGVWQEGALAHLTSFTLHSHGTDNRYYSIEKILPVFLSSTLKHLHLSCVDISGATKKLAALDPAQSIRTPLEILILQRCFVSTSQLDEFHAILSRPRALRSFTALLDVDFHELDAQRLHVSSFVDAIQQHSDSLEYLRYAHRPVDSPARGSPGHLNRNLFSALSTLRQSSPGLSTFHCLHTFDVDHRSNLAELLLDQALAPPNLRTLGLAGLKPNANDESVWRLRPNPDDEQLWRHLPAFLTAIASATPFSHLRLHTNPCRLKHNPISWHPPLRAILLDLVNALGKEKTVKLISSRSTEQLTDWKPPFLYKEVMPVEFIIFNSERGHADERFSVKKYLSEDGEVSGWRGPFSGLGNAYWPESVRYGY